MKRTYTKTQMIGILTIIFGIGMFIDILLHRFSPVGLFISIFLLILGRHLRKKGKRIRGNFLLISGVFFFVGNLFSSAAFQLVFVGILAYVGYELYTSSKSPATVAVETKIDEHRERILRSQPFLKNMFIGNYRLMNNVYELHDINIRYGIGDVQIDLTSAMIPEGETVIIIQGLIGNISLFVPYDIEISVNHSVIIGNISVLGEKEKGFNQNVVLMTEEFASASRRIKIISSLLVGDTEVRYA